MILDFTFQRKSMVRAHVVDLEASLDRVLRFGGSGNRCLGKRSRTGQGQQWSLADYTLVPQLRKRPVGEFSLSWDSATRRQWPDGREIGSRDL